MGNVISFKKTANTTRAVQHAARRADRQTRQLALFGQILTLDPEEQAGALFDTWPCKLPKAVRARISGELRKQWRKIRADEVAADEAAYVKALGEHLGHPLDLDEFLDLLPDDRVVDARIAYSPVARDIVQVLGAVPTIKCLTVNWLSQSFALDYPNQAVLDDGRLLDFLCLMVGFGGSILVREESRMKVQVTLSNGEHAWLAQERIYGFFCGQGGWVPQSAQTMRECYMTDAVTGKPLPVDPTTTMGDARELVRKSGVKVTPPI